MNLELLIVLLFGGVPVVSSYYYIYTKVTGNDVSDKMLWGGLKGNTFVAWTLSMILTVVSYGYLFYFFVWKSTFEEWEQILLLASYVLFFNYAGQYGAVAMLDIVVEKKSGYLLYTLLMVAVGCVGFLIIACVKSSGDTEGILAIVSASMMVFHHAYFDAYLWFQEFNPKGYASITSRMETLS